MTALERRARIAWVAWGGWAKWTICDGCDENHYCRRARRGPWLCLECFDQR